MAIFSFFNQVRGDSHPGLTRRHVLPQHLPLSPQIFGREGVWWRKSHLLRSTLMLPSVLLL